MNKENKDNALAKQVGGNHYKDFRIQPIEFIEGNNLGFAVGNVIKYVCRYKFKNGKEDLLKARHYIDLLMELEYGNENKAPQAHFITSTATNTTVV